ncbi:hypothetical protein BV25DRAFT_1828504 [Artomyces pyxidatus]|uniref:Uncharacterized protein n=1 Tax=Artomyces pyxidatus TaxID=48021 RepID=A0ACB8SV97_9AGAM|nr:hypothetical protein BV25DRAFT_1828504 [Artomyces pyxidatus]
MSRVLLHVDPRSAFSTYLLGLLSEHKAAASSRFKGGRDIRRHVLVAGARLVLGRLSGSEDGRLVELRWPGKSDSPVNFLEGDSKVRPGCCTTDNYEKDLQV